ncbi:hypothetical protein TrCOL_g6757 [Triparma columacea]|uniref:EGF-like domain-containing protein n=1 Tax=Triparma columacea TaxID=722753 RepID=A0A9W7G1K7_9STRA|nr:hypothetical protein TrCOL_g6757 [Triparma columacea]
MDRLDLLEGAPGGVVGLEEDDIYSELELTQDWSPDNLEDGFSLSQVDSARVYASAAIDAIDIIPRPKFAPAGAKRAMRLGVFGKFLLGLSVLANLIAAEELRGGISVAEERRKLAITLSGSNLGNCVVNGNCFSSLPYTNSEVCEFTTDVAGVLSVSSFATEANWDKLTVGGVMYDGTDGPDGVSVAAGDTISWFSDSYVSMAGFEICIGAPCTATTNPSDDGSSGDLYCINGGSVQGVAGMCTCTGCNLGFGGPSCAVCAAGFSGSDCSTAEACVATTTATDVGSDGNFYCVNGGSIGGTAGQCTCTGCDTGFTGESCHSTLHTAADMDTLFNLVSSYSSSWSTSTNTGNNLMANGDSAVLSTVTFKCSDGTCADSERMLYSDDSFGEVRCSSDDATCVIDGEEQRRVIHVSGTGSGKVTIRAITIQNGHAQYSGGGIYASTMAAVDVKLCLFINCQSTSTSSYYGGGAIYASTSGTILNVYGTSFSGSVSGGAGSDIKASSATIIIHATCPVPYSHLVAAQGK